MFQLRALQSTHSRSHTITQSFFIVGQTKKMKIWGFRALKTGRNFWVYVSFWRTFWLQRSLENFLEVVQRCSKYIKGAPNVGLCNALTLVVIRPHNHFLSCQTVNPPPVASFGNHFFTYNIKKCLVSKCFSYCIFLVTRDLIFFLRCRGRRFTHTYFKVKISII